jgi:uncharacterized protein YlzI (FlbEa/FlbD family)
MMMKIFLKIRIVKDGVHEQGVVNVDTIESMHMLKGEAETIIMTTSGQAIPVKESIENMMHTIGTINSQMLKPGNVKEMKGH